MTFSKQYIVRLDDASCKMDVNRWVKVYRILDQYDIRPLIGVIPSDEDPSHNYDYNANFWEMINQWQNDGSTIALHGFNHCYDKSTGGLNPMWPRSEFVGKTKEVQSQKIRDGYKILVDKGIDPKVFFAPSHTYDATTIECLKEYTPIRIISDTMAFNPYKEFGMIFIPQQSGHFINIPLPGTWTFCFHPNTMDDDEILKFESFINKYKSKFISFKDIDISNVNNKTIFDKLINSLYFMKRGKA